MDKLVLTRGEVAQALGVSYVTVDKLIRDGKLPSFRPSPRRVLIPADALRDFICNQAKVVDLRGEDKRED